MESFRGPETQVLRVKPSAHLSRFWNPGLESETQCPFIEVLKPRSWEPNAAMRAWRQGRIVSDRHEYPLVTTKQNILFGLFEAYQLANASKLNAVGILAGFNVPR
jgi:hypothetical protein